MDNKVSVKTIDQAAINLAGVAKKTPLQRNQRLSDLYSANIYFKREDLQIVRSYKIRGAYNKMVSLSSDEKQNGVVCASAGNHAQGVAYGAFLQKVKAVIFMPVTTPLQKINKVKHFGGEFVETKLFGNNFDESNKEAKDYAHKFKMGFIPPFDDYQVISGQGTVGKEIYDELGENLDLVLCPIGGGGLVAGLGTYLKEKNKRSSSTNKQSFSVSEQSSSSSKQSFSVSKNIEIIGVEPKGAPSMYESLKAKKVVTLESINTFVDGAAVKTVGEKTFAIASKFLKQIILVQEGKVCTIMIELYQNEGIITEPAGALAISALDEIKEKIKGKTVVCIVSGGNNDILRYPEIMEKSLVYLGLKHYFLIEFAQKPGQLRQFVDKALGPTDDIARFEYIKKTSKERGPALIGIEVSAKEDFEKLTSRMDKLDIKYTVIKDSDLLYSYLI